MQTSMPGLFAAGDIRKGSAALVAAVLGDGATAAAAAVQYLRVQVILPGAGAFWVNFRDASASARRLQVRVLAGLERLPTKSPDFLRTAVLA
jgi:hypothetical protein